MDTRGFLTRIYVDWRNNYLTPAKFAEHNGLTEEEAERLIELSRSVFYSKHPDQ